MRKILLALLFMAPGLPESPKPSIEYLIRIDSADLSGWDVEISLRNLPDTFRLAMAAHPEYDDRFYRYVTGVAVHGPSAGASIIRVDSMIWRVIAPGGQSTVQYRIQLPAAEPAPRAAWRPFLSPTGGLIGGPHAFMYVVGGEATGAQVKVEVPPSWKIATGLEPTADSRVFTAASADVLMESPIFAGHFHDWGFTARGAHHRVIYWAAPDWVPFDTTAFVAGLEGMVRQAVALFGAPPYRSYTFVFQDAAYGGLEHPNSVTLGAESRRLAEDPQAALEESAHEFFHTWNLLRIRPEEYGSVTYETQRPTAGLWFSEGLTLYYADLLLRRAGLPTQDTTRLAHLEHLISRYLANPGNSRFSAESISKVAYNAGPGALGDYTASAHLVGEVLGSMLDITIRHATGGERSMDDAMRLMLERHGGKRGFNGRDIEAAVEEVCRCEVTRFFQDHVRRGGRPIDFDSYLNRFGWKTAVTWQPAMRNNERERDLRIWGWEPPEGQGLRLVVTNPASAWGRAGLHSQDRLVSVNRNPVRTWPELRAILARAMIGDTLAFEVMRDSGPFRTTVTVAGFDQPQVRIAEIADPTALQLRLRGRWLNAE